MTSHKPGSSHQSNKPFKGRHKSKGKVKTELSGRVHRPNDFRGPKSSTVEGSRMNRKNAVKQNLKKKRDEKRMEMRLFDGRNGVPKIGLLVPLSGGVDVSSAYNSIKSWPKSDLMVDDESPLMDLKPRFNQTLQWLQAYRQNESSNDLKSDYEFVMEVLDKAKVADFIVFIFVSNEDADEAGNKVLSALKVQGMPDASVLVQNFRDLKPKRQQEVRKIISAFMENHIVNHVKPFAQDISSEMDNFIRTIAVSKVHKIKWREQRPYMLVDQMDYDEQGEKLEVTGFSRGHPFCADRLIHIPRFGDFQIEKIETEDQEYFPSPERQQHLISVNDVDDVEMENMGEGGDYGFEGSMEKRFISRRVPKGTSEYQAEWLIDDESSGEVSTDGENEYKVTSDHFDLSGEDNDFQMNVSEDEDELMDGDGMDEDEYEAKLEEYRRQKKCKDSPEDDLQFPDETECPLDVPARFRFRKFRGLKSFRTSEWDPYENLPVDYGRIFQFENFKSAKDRLKKILSSEKMVAAADAMTDKHQFNGPAVGKRMKIVLKCVPLDAYCHYRQPGNVLIVSGLLPQEEKVSVVNMAVKECIDEDELIRNKEHLLIQYGFRRIEASILLSQHSNGRLHKMERFMHKGQVCMASIYAPVLITSAPVLMFKQGNLVAHGNVESIDANRMVIKRKILTGVPTRIHPSSHRNTAVIRFMFHNKEDIEYYKPIELFTKHGRRGHILSSIGTHGAMKCGFDKPLKSMDTICLPLYKRTFPKWTCDGKWVADQ